MQPALKKAKVEAAAQTNGIASAQSCTATPGTAAVHAEPASGPPGSSSARQNGTGGATAQQAAAVAPKQQQKRKKAKKMTPETEICVAIQTAAKDGDPKAALAAYDRAMAEQIPIKEDVLNNLLFLCAGGNSWADRVHNPTAGNGGSAEASSSNHDDDLVAIMQRGRDIVDHMRTRNQPVGEMAYTALARMAASARQADKAFALAKQLLEESKQRPAVVPRLRSFTPALSAYCAEGRPDKAFEVDALLQELQFDMTEAEFAQLLGVCAHGASREQTHTLLRRMAKELTTLQPATLDAARAYFTSATAAAAPAEQPSASGFGGSWVVETASVSDQGICSTCGGQLQPIDLELEEWGTFADAIARLANEREKRPNDFASFQQWLDRHGPFDVLVDAANVALFGQNFERGDFSFAQVEAVVKHFRQQHPESKLLVVLHAGRLNKPPAQQPAAQKLLNQLRRENAFYATPFGSNDDWYWLYAAVRAGRQGMLISNDEMRDHIFSLLAPRFFQKWKQRHLLRYTFDAKGPIIDYPPPYTTCIQHLATGSWMFPAAADHSWLCARPQSQG
ncbi:hypothetical protein WJX72_003811 [[Myrmecia] bisecta]|uniref:Mitochondrial ribonuclease P catalytic subunit n=1 Tax=[Myrmecia] bisecta TaxID=41462 RepID=A0AAW1R600_9CHLO